MATSSSRFFSSPRIATVGLAALVTLGIGFTLHQAFALRIHYYDTYDYLNDARRLGGDRSAAYYRVHSPLVPVLAIPVARAIGDVEPPDAPIRWVLPHLLGVALAVFTLVLVFLWLRDRAGTRWALLGLVLLIGTRLFVRYSPFLLVDIATAGWAAAAFLAWARATSAHGRPWHYALFGLAVAGGMLTKYSMLILPVPFAAAELVRIAVERRIRWRRIGGGLLGAAVAAATFWLFMSTVFTSLDRRPFTFETLRELLTGSSAAVAALPHETPWDYAPMLVSCVSFVTVALAALGAAASLRTGWRRDLPVAIWVVLFFAVFSLAIGHNEARYLWPALPGLIYFAVLGARTLFRSLAATAPRLRSAVAVGLLAIAIRPGVAQAIRDSHPFFRTPIQPEVVRFVQENTRNDRTVFWTGHFVALTPPNPNADLPQDEFFDFFHLAHPCIHMMTDGRVVGVDAGDPAAFLRARGNDGDAMIVGPPFFVYAQTSSEPPATFEMLAIRRVTLRREGDLYVDDEGAAWLRAEGDDLVALDDLGELDLHANVPLGRRTLARGDRVRGAAGAERLQVVRLVRRELPASFRE